MSIKKSEKTNAGKAGPYIKAWIASKSLSYQGFADLWEGSKGAVSDIVNGNNDPSYKVLRSLRRTGMSIDQLIDNAEGLVPSVAEQQELYSAPPKLSDDEAALLKAYRGLDESDKGCALRMVVGLRAAEEESEKSGNLESGCKVVNLGRK